MEYKQLLTDIEQVSLLLTEGKSDGKLLYKIKKKIKEYVTSVPDAKLKETIPNILKHITKHFSSKNSKYLLVFLVKILLTVGVSVTGVKDIYANNQVDDLVKWERFEERQIDGETINFNHDYNIGEYQITDNVLSELSNQIENQISKDDTLIIKGIVIVSISVENNEFSNYANDDSKAEKDGGGKLIQKRKSEARKAIKSIENELNDKGYNVKFNMSFKSKKGLGRLLKFEDVEVFSKTKQNIKLTKKDAFIDQDFDNIENDDAVISGGGDPTIDIKGLSKNYQYVELLKLGGIETDRVQGDRRDNLYAEWIVDTRKHPKRMLKRLQMEYPEYNIEYDANSKSRNPVVGARKGMSNIHQQYQEVKESYMFNFNEFMLENNEEFKLQRVWQKILGRKFPELTQEQAEMFDKNIEHVLNYLEQMYGSSAIGFKYNVA